MKTSTRRESKTPSQFQLTQAELLFALRSINLPDIPGVGEKPWGELELSEARRQFREAGLGLKSRGWIWLDEKTGQPAMEKSLEDVLSTCAYPKQMMALVHQIPPDAAVENYFYRRDGLTVHHTLPQPRQHNFQVIPDSDMGMSLFESLFASFAWDFDSLMTEIPQAAYEQAVQMVSTDENRAQQLLCDAGFAESLAGQFIGGMREHKVQAHSQWVYEFQPKVRQNILIFFAGEKACWMVEKEAEKKVMRIKAITAASLRLLTRSVFNSF
jgi:hypothetical protein